MKRTHTPIPPILCSNNHHPWRNSSTSTIVSSNNSSKNDNADNINACLKRIRISSTSPGELALNSDLAHLADEVSLYRTNQTTWFSSDHKVSFWMLLWIDFSLFGHSIIQCIGHIIVEA